jgi:hypothetical protein
MVDRLVTAGIIGLPIEISFHHYGLANATLALAVVTFLTGVVLLAGRYGYVVREHWHTVVRVTHVVVGIAMTLYLLGTYLFTPA